MNRNKPIESEVKSPRPKRLRLSGAVVNVYKPIGLTPLQLVERFKEKYPEYKRKKIGYAGRLDPMAEGVLILLIGKENKESHKYQKLSKEYKFTAFFGIETDTYDILGLIKGKKIKTCPKNFQKKLKASVKDIKGKLEQKYPPYSSYNIRGRALFYWARKGKLSEIDIPSKEIEIFNLELLGNHQIDAKFFEMNILKKITSVKGNFRQKEISDRWQQFFIDNPHKEFTVFNFSVSCSSGTYVRSIVHELGKKLRTGAVTLHIKRPKVGDYSIRESLIL